MTVPVPRGTGQGQVLRWELRAAPKGSRARLWVETLLCGDVGVHPGRDHLAAEERVQPPRKAAAALAIAVCAWSPAASRWSSTGGGGRSTTSNPYVAPEARNLPASTNPTPVPTFKLGARHKRSSCRPRRAGFNTAARPGHPIGNGVTRNFHVRGSIGFAGQGGHPCGIPRTATAVAASITTLHESAGRPSARGPGGMAPPGTTAASYPKSIQTTTGATLTWASGYLTGPQGRGCGRQGGRDHRHHRLLRHAGPPHHPGRRPDLVRHQPRGQPVPRPELWASTASRWIEAWTAATS